MGGDLGEKHIVQKCITWNLDQGEGLKWCIILCLVWIYIEKGLDWSSFRSELQDYSRDAYYCQELQEHGTRTDSG